MIAPRTTDPAAALAATQVLAHLVIAVAAVILLWYLYAYTEYVAVGPARHRTWYLAIAVGAAFLYGSSGVLALETDIGWSAVFSEGATLFFILFLALWLRAMYYSCRRGGETGESPLPSWIDYLIIGAFVVAWWSGFLVAHRFTPVVVSVGWVLASVWALWYAILVVRRHEGTSIAALTRFLFPAVLAFTVTVLADLVGSTMAGAESVVAGTWIVGTVLVGAFLFTTAVAIRQQGGEVERMYDWTTWRAGGRAREDDERSA
ncbi:MAG: hypothetical protein ABEJ76_09430 [Halanaeroarchaeum sp.]